jgi:hypothetical protein
VTLSPNVEIALVFGLAVLAAVTLWLVLRRKPTPEELEKRRRAAIYANGKLGDAEVIEIEGVAIVYSYSVGGVGYTASQDIAAFEAQLPENTMTLIGPALVKFDPRNPANSIVICEDWNGLGGRKRS